MSLINFHDLKLFSHFCYSVFAEQQNRLTSLPSTCAPETPPPADKLKYTLMRRIITVHKQMAMESGDFVVRQRPCMKTETNPFLRKYGNHTVQEYMTLQPKTAIHISTSVKKQRSRWERLLENIN
jgi:hypothetical protein